MAENSNRIKKFRKDVGYRAGERQREGENPSTEPSRSVRASSTSTKKRGQEGPAAFAVQEAPGVGDNEGKKDTGKAKGAEGRKGLWIRW